MLAKLLDGAVVGIDGAVRTREHDTAFHGDKDEGGEGIDVGASGERGLHLNEALADGFDPSLEILRDELVGRRIFGINLKSQPPERAAEGAVRHKDSLAVSGEDGEDAVYWLADAGEGRIDDHGAEQLDVLLEDCAE